MNQAETPAIRIAGMTVRYGRRVAVDAASLEVPRGSVYALLGRNGAGKSSLVRCALGQQRASSGSARILGEDAWKHRTRLMERIGVVAEDADAPPEMRVQQLADFHTRIYSRWDAKAFDARLRGHTFIGFIRRFGADDGDAELHWHLSPDTAEVAAAVKESVVLRELSGS